MRRDVIDENLIDDAALERFLDFVFPEIAEREAEAILAEVHADATLKDVTVPPELHDAIFKAIREYEANKKDHSADQESSPSSDK